MMLQGLRERAKGFGAWFIVLAIVTSFALFGISNFFLDRISSGTAATVNGQKISWESVATLSDRIAKQQSIEADPKMIWGQVLNSLIEQAAVVGATKKLGLDVSLEHAEERLVKMPHFQVGGKFSKERYLELLEQNKFTDLQFRKALQQDLLLEQLMGGIFSTSFTLPQELKRLTGILEQKRDFGYFIIPFEQYQKDIVVSEDEVHQYFQNHQSKFVKPEQVSLEYVELSLPKLADGIQITPEEVAQYYKEHQSAFSTPERVRARHILILSNSPEEEAKAKQTLEGIQARLQKGEDFVALAKAHSEDPGSAAKGGDLDWFVRGQMVPPFEAAAFGLKKINEISPIVQTQFGYHLIQLTGHEKATVKPLKEVQTLAKEQLKQEKAEVLFAKKAEAMAKLAFEQPASLEPLTDLGLKISSTELFSREQAEGIAKHPEVNKAAFSDLLIKEHRNSEPLKLSETSMAVVRLKQHVAATQQTEASVAKTIRALLTNERTQAKVKSLGEAWVKEIVAGKSPADLAARNKLPWKVLNAVSRNQDKALDPSILNAAFQLPNHPKATQGLVLANHDYLIIQLLGVKEGDWSKMGSEAQKGYQDRLQSLNAQMEYGFYVNDARDKAKVSYAEKAPF